MKKNIKQLIAVWILAIGFSSCLKEKGFMDPSKTHNVVELAATGTLASTNTSPIAMYTNAFDVQPEVDFGLIISYSGADVAPQDITVKLVVDPTLIDAYNTANPTATPKMNLLPEANYTLPNMTVVIPKGQQQVVAHVKLKTTLFDFSKPYGLPIKIQSASTGVISGNFGQVIYKTVPKNKYEAKYTHTYTSTLGNGTNNVTMTTTGANSNTFPLIGVYTGNPAYITIDPATNKVTVDVPSLSPTVTDPISNYDPATKTFRLKYTTPGRTFDETFVRQ